MAIQMPTQKPHGGTFAKRCLPEIKVDVSLASTESSAGNPARMCIIFFPYREAELLPRATSSLYAKIVMTVDIRVIRNEKGTELRVHDSEFQPLNNGERQNEDSC